MATALPIVFYSLNGGEISPRFEARFEQNKRQSGLAKCENWIPLTVGGVRRREGSVFVAMCKVVPGHPGKHIMGFRSSNDASYTEELGYQYMRFFRDGLPIFSSGATPFEVITPYADTDLLDINADAQSIDVKYFFHRNYPPHKLQRITPTTFVFVPVAFNPPPTVEEEPTGADLGGGTLTPSLTTGTGVNFTASAGSPFLASSLGRLIVSGASQAIITNVLSGNVVTANILDAFLSTAPIPDTNWRLRLSPQATLDVDDGKKEIGDVTNLTAVISTFYPQDVNKYVSIFGGLVQITAVTSDTIALTTIKATLRDIDVTNPAPTRAWTLEVPAWSPAKGYPSCATFTDNRLFIFQGLTINGSVTNDFENFAKGSGDSDAIQRTISDDDIDPIVWAKGLQTLLVGTGSGAFEISATNPNGSLTPSDFNVKPVSSRGCARIPPVRIGGLLHYVQYGQRRLRELVFDFATNRFKTPNVFQFAEHLTDAYYLTEIFYAAEPDSLVYAVRSDGTLLALVYQEDENVMGWAPITTQGRYRSGCVIPRPSTGKDWVWTITDRQNGSMVEYFEPDKQGSNREWNEAQTDSCVFATPDANFVVTGLDHLDGQIVRVIGDGMLYDDKVVQSGQITITPQILSDVFEIGLDYKSIGKTLEPIVPVEQGGPFQSCGYDMLGLKVRRALGLTLNGEQMAYRTPYNSMDKQVPLQKGKLTITNLGYDPFNRVSFEQNLPFPAEILNIVGELKVGTTWKEGIEPDATPAFSFIGSGNISDMFVINFIVNSARQDYVLYAELVAAGWNRISPVSCTFLLTPSGFLSASNQTGFAFDTGAPLPTGSIEPILTFQNVVQGCPGNGGAGGLGNQNGAPGFAGSDAMNVQYNITIDVSAGIIRSGSGGGGGGGGGYFGDSIESQGGSGGGGIAVPGLPGGLDAGAGGASGHDWAEAGSSGDPGVAGVGGAGGAPGKAIRLNGHTVHFVGDHDATHVIGAVS